MAGEHAEMIALDTTSSSAALGRRRSSASKEGQCSGL